MNKYITIEGQNGSFSAYIARPKASPASAVVVLQELFGVNADIRQHCDELANKGTSPSRRTSTGDRNQVST